MRNEPKQVIFIASFVLDPVFSIQDGKLPGYQCAMVAIKGGLGLRRCDPTAERVSYRGGRKSIRTGSMRGWGAEIIS